MAREMKPELKVIMARADFTSPLQTVLAVEYVWRVCADVWLLNLP